jgi:Fic family protein
MLRPKYTITNAILKQISAIEACREMINNAPLIPAWEKRFAQEAVARTVHFGTHLEGNALDLEEVKKVIEGEKILAHERDVQEVINYRRVMDFIDEQAAQLFSSTKDDQTVVYPEYTIDQLVKIHRLTVARLLPEERCGVLRNSRVVIKNSQTGEVTFSPPPPIEVPYQLEDFYSWLNSDKGRDVHSALRSGISHFELVRVHPFVDGNGRVARAFSTFILYCEGYDVKRFFSLEEHFDKEAMNYYGYLQRASSGQNDLTPWLEYFTKSLAIEFTRVKDKILKLSSDYEFKTRLGRQITISDRQEKLIRYLKRHDYAQVSQARKRILPDVSDDTVLRELLDLMKKGIVKKVGKTKGARYAIV